MGYIMSPVLINKMKELTKKAKKQNKVITLAEAFDMYPVEEEKHKGKIEKCLEGERKLDV